MVAARKTLAPTLKQLTERGRRRGYVTHQEVVHLFPQAEDDSEVMNIIGDVEGRHCILIDDIVDSAGTLCNAAEALLEEKAASVSAYVTHGVLSNGAAKRVEASKLSELVVTNSIDPATRTSDCKKLRVISVAALMGDAIWRIANEQSVSSLFE